MVLSDNAIEADEIKTRRVVTEGNFGGLSVSVGLNSEYEEDPRPASYSSSALFFSDIV